MMDVICQQLIAEDEGFKKFKSQFSELSKCMIEKNDEYSCRITIEYIAEMKEELTATFNDRKN